MTILITGASTGIGFACATHLAGLGHDVLAGVRKAADGERVEAAGHGHITHVIVDVADEQSVQAAAARVREITGDRGLGGLVNNAGIGAGGPIETTELAAWKRQFDVNLFGAIATTRALIPQIRQAKGRVVNIGSIGGRVALPYMSPYNASKFALRAFTDSLRMEMSDFGVHVALIEPGSVATPIWEKAGETTVEVREKMDPEAQRLYGPVLEGMDKIVAETAARGIPPVEVARAVEHALTASKPRTKYLVGRDAKLRAKLVKVMPDRVMDRAILKQIRG